MIQASDRWPTFPELLQHLHQEGIYIHAEQLAEFLLFHGLPVELCYVPEHLQERAKSINEHYQGDMVRRSERLETPNFVECYREFQAALNP